MTCWRCRLLERFALCGPARLCAMTCSLCHRREEDGLLRPSAFVAKWRSQRCSCRRQPSRPPAIPANRNCLRPARQWTARAALRAGGTAILRVLRSPMKSTNTCQRHGHDVFKKSGAADSTWLLSVTGRRTYAIDNPQNARRGSFATAGRERAVPRSQPGNAEPSRSFQERDAVYFSRLEIFSCTIRAASSGRCASLGVLLFGVSPYASGAWQTRLLPILASFCLHMSCFSCCARLPLGLLSVCHWLYLHVLP